MQDRRRARHWSDYVFGEIGSQELDDFGEAIRSPCVTSAEVWSLAQAMADRARSYFGNGDGNGDGDRDDGEWAARGMLDGADAEVAGLQYQRIPRARRMGVSSGAVEETARSTALCA